MEQDLAEVFRGATPEELVRALVPEGWIIEPSRTGGGTRYKDGRGNQVRIMPGYPDHAEPSHRGPHAIASFAGARTRILLSGNPMIENDG